jgi:hypothetical protein
LKEIEMNMKINLRIVSHSLFTNILPAVFILLSLHLRAQAQIDTLYPYLSKTPVVIDGMADDACWQEAQWHPIDQVWIPYGASIDEGDFQGRFKLAWDSLYLYLLAEIVDDSLSDDHPDPLQNWWDDDCLEVFIDENRSKGNHERNNNAFAYHISLFYDAIDLNASGAGINYKNNIEVVMDTIAGDSYLWEVAIKNYTSAFTVSDPEASRVYLYHHKLMGFSLAYCDNDETTSRENFIGSQYMTAATANSNYITADYFGPLLLVDPDYVEPTSIQSLGSVKPVYIYPNPVHDDLRFQTNTGQIQPGKIEITDLCGKTVVDQSCDPYSQLIDVRALKEGLYLLHVVTDGHVYTQPFIKMN